jgi:hypothetical protein
MVTMMEYIKNIIKDFLEEIVGTKTFPAADHLFTVKDPSLAEVLPEEHGAHTVHDNCWGHTGAAMSFGQGMALSYSWKHSINTKSSTEAELVGVDDSLGYILWARYFMVEQGYDMEPSLLYQDNMSNILLKINGRASSSKQTKHIKVKYYLIKDKVDRGEITIEHCPTEQMWTDINMKPKQGAVFRAFRRHVMGIPADYNDASYATRCNFRPPSWVPEPVSMLPIPRDWVAAQECVGDTTKGPKPTASRPAAMVRFCCGRGGTCSANRANCGANQTGSTRTN